MMFLCTAGRVFYDNAEPHSQPMGHGYLVLCGMVPMKHLHWLYKTEQSVKNSFFNANKDYTLFEPQICSEK